MELRKNRARERRAILLIDLLMYMALLSIVLIIAAVVFDKMLTNSANLRRNIADIERAARAGERWRADVRSATDAIWTGRAADGETIVIPQREGEIVYSIGAGEVRRTVTGRAPSQMTLASVRAARMFEERRGHITAWSWHLELQTRQKNARVRPHFAFSAVPGRN